MRRTIYLLFGILVLWTGCARTPVGEQCMADAERFIADVEKQRNTFDETGMFGTALGQLSTRELLSRNEELVGCTASDPGHHALYREALDNNDSVESDRFLKYLNDTQQTQDFARWEQQRQARATTR
jgi:hypothetical protein